MRSISRIPTFLVALVVAATTATTVVAQFPDCVGDCDGNGAITVDEILLGVNIALGSAPMSGCLAFDADDSGDITVDELIAAVDGALRGCVTIAPTPTPEAIGPRITSLSLAGADIVPVNPSGIDDAQREIYSRLFGTGLWVIVEAVTGASGLQVGTLVFQQEPTERTARPDIQLIVSRPLGDGNPIVCDNQPGGGGQGGVPAAEPFAFGAEQLVTDVINEMSCRVDGGARTNGNDACSIVEGSPFGSGFVGAETRAIGAGGTQFCVRIDAPWRFPVGDTIVAARVRDRGGNPGPVREMVVRVAQ